MTWPPRWIVACARNMSFHFSYIYFFNNRQACNWTPAWTVRHVSAGETRKDRCPQSQSAAQLPALFSLNINTHEEIADVENPSHQHYCNLILPWKFLELKHRDAHLECLGSPTKCSKKESGKHDFHHEIMIPSSFRYGFVSTLRARLCI